MRPIIKVCGMRSAQNIRKAEALGIDWMGFIFWPKSSRYITECPAYLPTKCKRIGVFVDEDIKTIKKIAGDYALDYIQLHGSESPTYCKQLNGFHLIKAFNIATAEDFLPTTAYEGLVDYFLFDTKAQLPGGSGQQFDWTVLADYVGETPFLLSGGIGPKDAVRLRTLFSAGSGSIAAKCLGIDLNSRFETAPGLKDIAALRNFITQLSH